jgi:hypothetical protein
VLRVVDLALVHACVSQGGVADGQLAEAEDAWLFNNVLHPVLRDLLVSLKPPDWRLVAVHSALHRAVSLGQMFSLFWKWFCELVVGNGFYGLGLLDDEVKKLTSSERTRV